MCCVKNVYIIFSSSLEFFIKIEKNTHSNLSWCGSIASDGHGKNEQQRKQDVETKSSGMRKKPINIENRKSCYYACAHRDTHSPKTKTWNHCLVTKDWKRTTTKKHIYEYIVLSLRHREQKIYRNDKKNFLMTQKTLILDASNIRTIKNRSWT